MREMSRVMVVRLEIRDCRCWSRSKAVEAKISIEIAHSHHEKWDGSGYPDKLAGEAIPLAAQIMAVADVYDALTTARPYKAPFTHESAYDLIMRGSGAHFAPMVVSAFIKCQPRVVEIASTWKDDLR